MKQIRNLLVAMTVFVIAFPSLAADADIVQVGDILRIDLPGESAFQEPFEVDREGRIVLPQAGSIAVVNLTLVQLKDKVRSVLATTYRDLDLLAVAIKEKRLAVTVLGYVKKPGSITLERHASVQMAINAAGGLSQGAQLNKLQVRRGNDVLIFDYKRYLDTGDIAILPELRSLDVLFVPASPLTGNVQVDFDAKTLTAAGDSADDAEAIKVFGEVHRPGVFTYKEGNTVVDILMRAGGVTRYAGVEQIRVISENTPKPFNLREYLDTGDRRLMPSVGPGDIVFVPQASEAVKAGARTVYIMGEVFKPGAYETESTTTFLDLLANAGGPTRYAESRHIRVLRADGSVQPFDLQAYTEGLSNEALPTIRPGDAILVPVKNDFNENSWLQIAPSRAVRIMGSVHRPGRYEWSDEMSILDLIAHAGGPRAEADAAHIQILPPVGTGKIRPITFDFQKFVDKGGSFDTLPHIAAGYTVVIPELPRDPNDNRSQWVRQSAERSIYVFGAVGAPGRYAFNEDLSFLDILSAANGPTSFADIRKIRITHRGERHARVSKLNLNLYFETGDESLLPKVQPQDVIYVPDRRSAWLDKERGDTVRVLGAVGKPGRYAFDDTMTILDLLAEAGGPTSEAYQEKIVVVNRRVGGQPTARTFDLVAFAKGGDFGNLPVLRAGDTVYVPNISESPRHQFRETLKDIVSLITIAALAF